MALLALPDQGLLLPGRLCLDVLPQGTGAAEIRFCARKAAIKCQLCFKSVGGSIPLFTPRKTWICGRVSG